MVQRPKHRVVFEQALSSAVVRGAILVAAVVAAGACGGDKKCVDKSKDELESCRAESDKLQQEIVSLKRQLAQALANPGSIKIDPEVLKIDGKVVMPKLKEGTLTQQQVIRTMSQNKPVLKQCYERALKKNNSLRHQKITVTVGFKVRPNGTPSDISVRPNYDSTMIDCMRKAIRRWRFPSFKGQPVGVESPLTLTPKR
jgi:hypothetical protein